MAIGDTVGTLSVDGHADATFTLVNNPNGSFAISGSNLVQAQDLPSGNYDVRVKAVGAGLLVNQSISLRYSVPPLPPDPGDLVYLLGADDAYLKGADGAYLLGMGPPVFNPTPSLTALYVSQGIY